MIKFGNRIKELRVASKLNQKEFAAQIDVVQASLSAYENDLKQPSLEVLMRISKKFNVSLDWLCSNPSKKHFVTGADIIDLFMELQNIPGFDYEIDISADDIGYDTACLKFVGERKDTSEKVFDIAKFITFLNELSEIKAKFKILDDPEFTKSYFDMWLEKKKQYYSTMKVEYPGEREDRIELELFHNLPDGMDTGDE